MGILRQNFTTDTSGQVAVTFAMMVVPLFAVTTAAVDFASVTKERRAISGALDAAVLAAANNNAITLDEKDDYAETYFRSNYEGVIDFALTPSVSPDRVRLAAEGTLELTFGKVIGIKDPIVSEVSAATIATDKTICVLALSEDEDAAIRFDPDIEFAAKTCSVHSNSKSARAIVAERNIHKPTAQSFCAVGGVHGQVEPHSKGECRTVADPYESVKPATLSACKREFIVDSLGVNNIYGGQDYSYGGASGGYGNQTAGTSTMADGSDLPPVNPVSYDELLAELKQRYNNKQKLGTDDGPDHERREAIEAVRQLGGLHMKKLLEAYDSYGESLDCKDNIKPACYGFDNPFLDVDSDEVPRRGLVADIFDISYGAYLNPNAAVPDIVEQGRVELVDGQLYSRNNVDNELVPVSANLTGGNIQLTPGTYCGGLTVDGLRVRFAPGDYIFKDGPLTFLNKSEASANNVTFGFMGDGATMNVEGGSKLKIKAASTGPRKGLAFMQMIDQWAPGNRGKTTGVNRIASGGSISMSGTAYFPQQTLLISGEDSHIGASSPAVGLIANKIEFRGDRGSRVEIAVDHVKAGVPPIEPRVDDGVRLIE